MTEYVASLVSVVIVNYNRCDDLRQALFSVKSQDYSPVEIIVVDNVSTDGSVEMLAAEFPEVLTIRSERNIGMDGYSTACRAARGEFIFQMDNDSLMPDPTVLSSVVAGFRSGPANLAILATRVEEYQAAIHSIDDLRKKTNKTEPTESLGYHSGGVGFRKCLLDQVGYYNEDIFLYGAELFVQMKVLAAGFKIFFYPGILMLHKSSGVARSTRGVYYEVRNRYWFMRHFGTVAQQMWFVPSMLLHDLIYVCHRQAVKSGFRGLVDGFRKLPDSLQPPQRSTNPKFQQAVNATGHNFGVSALVSRIVRRTLFAKDL